MKTHNFKILAFVFVGIILITPYLAHAQSDALKSALEEVLEGGASIEVTDPATTRSALQKVIKLSLLEINELKKNLKKLGVLEEDYEVLREQFLGDLDNHFDSFKSFESEFADDLNSEELKAIGAELRDWREANYDEEIRNIANFILVFQQGKALKIAEKRLEKTFRDLAKIKPALKNELVRLADEARGDLEEAKKLISSAKQSFIIIENEVEVDEAATSSERVVSETTTTEGISATTTTSTTTSTIAVLEKKNDPQKLAADAVAKIKEAYLNFFRISVLIKKLR